MLLFANCVQAQQSEVIKGQYILKTAEIATDPGSKSLLFELSSGDIPGRTLARHGSTQSKLVQLFSGDESGAQAADGAKAVSKNRVVFDPDIAAADCAALKLAHPNIIDCEPNYIFRAALSSNDPGRFYLWGMERIKTGNGWDTTTGSKNVVVAIVDSGIDYTHEDLADNMWINTGEIPNNGIDDDNDGYIDDVYGVNAISGSGNPFDDNGHGTHCAGTIGAVGNNGLGVVGVNWQVSLMAAKFLDSEGEGSNADAIAAITYAVDHGATVINASWGAGDNSRSLYDAILYAKEHGVLFVAAAGNDGRNNDIRSFYPASYGISNIVAVAASDENDSLASFSNYGSSSVQIAAPGQNILSTVPGGYAEMSGTSMATPQVAGLAALIRSVFPNITVSELRSRILNGDSLASLKGKLSTGKRIDVVKALSGPAGAQSGASIINLLGSRGTNVLYPGEPFSASLSGVASSTSKLSLKFLSSSNQTLGQCSLGSKTIGQNGTLAITGTLTLDGLLAKTAKVTFSADHSSAKRKVHTVSGASKKSRKGASLAKDLKKSCRDIKLSLSAS